MRILLADDHEVVRRGVRQALEEALDGAEFGETATCAETLARAHEGDWDLLVLDLNMPGRGGLEVLAELHAHQPKLKILVLSMSPEQEFAVRALKSGAAGYLGKQAVARELVDAVRKILGGGRYITPAVAELLATGLGADDTRAPHAGLSVREMQVLRLIAVGRSVKEIAAELALSDKTVFAYRERMRAKLGLKGDVELARYALRHGLVDH